jgi:hypothetical protein
VKRLPKIKNLTTDEHGLGPIATDVFSNSFVPPRFKGLLLSGLTDAMFGEEI